MLVCVVGTSTGFAYWAFGVAWHALQEQLGDIHHVRCTAIADLQAQWEQRAGRAVLFTTDYLEEAVSKLILESGVPIVAILDTADVAIVTAVKLRPMSFLDSIRHTSLYISSLADALAKPSTVAFGSKARSAPVRQFLPRFLAALGLPDDARLTDRVLRRICPNDALWDLLTVGQAIEASQPTISVQETLTGWSERDVQAFRKVAADYQQILDRKPFRNVTWPAAILHSQTMNYTTERPLALIGPARPLIWGPYMHLPKGGWTARMEFEVSNNHSKNQVIAAILVGEDSVNQGEFNFPVQGVFVWDLAFEIDDISKPVEVRLTLPKSAIEGEFFLREVRISNLAED